MFGVAVLTGLVVAGIIIGTLRVRKASSPQDMPSPFRDDSHR